MDKLILLINFLVLVIAVSSESVLRCHWCGPLAEQVHRSRRAAPCSALDNQTTECEPGYDYCATVATVPPYKESRFCVKLYQDECYPLYCSTTGKWKMICPCKGDLCNGPNTERESEAFAILDKLLAKTNSLRTKRLVDQEHHEEVKNNETVNNDTQSIQQPDNTHTEKPNASNDTNSGNDKEKIENQTHAVSTPEDINVKKTGMDIIERNVHKEVTEKAEITTKETHVEKDNKAAGEIITTTQIPNITNVERVMATVTEITPTLASVPTQNSTTKNKKNNASSLASTKFVLSICLVITFCTLTIM